MHSYFKRIGFVGTCRRFFLAPTSLHNIQRSGIIWIWPRPSIQRAIFLAWPGLCPSERQYWRERRASWPVNQSPQHLLWRLVVQTTIAVFPKYERQVSQMRGYEKCSCFHPESSIYSYFLLLCFRKVMLPRLTLKWCRKRLERTYFIL